MNIRNLLAEISRAEAELDSMKRLSESIKSDKYIGVRVDFLSRTVGKEKSIMFPGITYQEISALSRKKLEEAEKKVESLSQMLQAAEEKANEVLSEMRTSIND